MPKTEAKLIHNESTKIQYKVSRWNDRRSKTKLITVMY